MCGLSVSLQMRPTRGLGRALGRQYIIVSFLLDCYTYRTIVPTSIYY